MDNFILLCACFVIGMLLRRSGRLPENAHAGLNGFIINISLPAVTLASVHALKPSIHLLFPIAMEAHENWVLTREQTIALNAQPRPYIFTHFTATNIALLLISLAVCAGWMVATGSDALVSTGLALITVSGASTAPRTGLAR